MAAVGSSETPVSTKMLGSNTLTYKSVLHTPTFNSTSRTSLAHIQQAKKHNKILGLHFREESYCDLLDYDNVQSGTGIPTFRKDTYVHLFLLLFRYTFFFFEEDEKKAREIEGQREKNLKL